MRIGIDIRYLSHALVGGVHYYVKHLVPALWEMGSDHEFVLYADRKAALELEQWPRHVAVRYLDYRNGLSSVANDLLLLRWAMAADRLDLAHFPANYGFAPPGVAGVVTLHDEINIMPLPAILGGHAKQPRTMAMMTYLHFVSRLTLRRAAGLLTVSQYARQQILRYTPRFPPERIAVTYHAPPPDLRRIEAASVHAALRERHGITRPYLLADGLKNPAVLVRAWQHLPAELRANYLLVFFARRQPWPAVDTAVQAGFARLLLRPPRDDLLTLFSGAEAFLFPSWIEGFGIPLLEAMSCGAPVIASDRGAIPEVVADAALLADAEDEVAFAQHITSVLRDQATAERLRTRGYARAAQFSWPQTAQQTLAAYERMRNR
ncbi:glycosyltransferase family 4 protein [Candidatus Viridilinea mediisalina]|uniref:Glycosyl transferase family 1 n=1 Tax=Candidatus Viridilinea mediisalina TaxID=2024553 RepID=A0A2A6RNA0_9CHLR|nr:glycosyltransferase family 1 protein [Candidatus Viridilinea mediisalina]PDW04349.1 glycosyl transferase family 1 [Candidatus Viridilinea mediisalina]